MSKRKRGAQAGAKGRGREGPPPVGPPWRHAGGSLVWARYPDEGGRGAAGTDPWWPCLVLQRRARLDVCRAAVDGYIVWRFGVATDNADDYANNLETGLPVLGAGLGATDLRPFAPNASENVLFYKVKGTREMMGKGEGLDGFNMESFCQTVDMWKSDFLRPDTLFGPPCM